MYGEDTPQATAEEHQQVLLKRYFTPLSYSQAALRHGANTSDTTMLDVYGVDAVLEEIARGRLINELAAYYNIAVLAVRRWLDHTADPKQYSEALVSCAESLVVRSQQALASRGFSSAAEASMLRAQADQMMLLASRIDARTWSPATEKVATYAQIGSGQSATPIQINIFPADNPSDPAGIGGGSSLIPGLQRLGRSASPDEDRLDT